MLWPGQNAHCGEWEWHSAVTKAQNPSHFPGVRPGAWISYWGVLDLPGGQIRVQDPSPCPSWLQAQLINVWWPNNNYADVLGSIIHEARVSQSSHDGKRTVTHRGLHIVPPVDRLRLVAQIRPCVEHHIITLSHWAMHTWVEYLSECLVPAVSDGYQYKEGEQTNSECQLWMGVLENVWGWWKEAGRTLTLLDHRGTPFHSGATALGLRTISAWSVVQL